MNTVRLEVPAHSKNEPGWLRQALRGLARPASHPGAALAERADGAAGRLAARLGAILDDNWTLIDGYANHGGRLDQVLVGPRGVLALACTGLNGRIHCDGQRWRRDKFDLYNNLVERDAPVPADPAGSLYGAAATLQQLLAAQSSIRHVRTALVFTHPAATLGDIRHALLNMVTLLADLKSATLLQAMSGQPDHRTIDGVVEVIRHDHARFLRAPQRRSAAALAQRR